MLGDTWPIVAARRGVPTRRVRALGAPRLASPPRRPPPRRRFPRRCRGTCAPPHVRWRPRAFELGSATRPFPCRRNWRCSRGIAAERRRSSARVSSSGGGPSRASARNSPRARPVSRPARAAADGPVGRGRRARARPASGRRGGKDSKDGPEVRRRRRLDPRPPQPPRDRSTSREEGSPASGEETQQRRGRARRDDGNATPREGVRFVSWKPPRNLRSRPSRPSRLSCPSRPPPSPSPSHRRSHLRRSRPLPRLRARRAPRPRPCVAPRA